MERSDPVRLELPTSVRIGLALGGLLLVGMLATLVAVLISLEGTRSEIRTTRVGVLQTDARLGRVTSGLDPVLRAVAPLTSPASGRALARKGRSLLTAADLVPGLAGDARRAADATEFIGQTVDAARLGPSLGALRSLVPDAGRLLTALEAPGPRSLAACEARLQVRAPADAGQIGCVLRFLPSVRRLLRTQTALNARSLRTQRRTLAAVRESLAIQREILVHVRSIDDKTLGPAPASPPLTR